MASIDEMSSGSVDKNASTDGTISNLFYITEYIANLYANMVSRFAFSLPETDASGKTMDERRKEHVAYEYLCHLEEAKKLVDLNSTVQCEIPACTHMLIGLHTNSL